ncbi:MAG TPA: methylated-DNA--[protein]-cysteine S-methyltransferase [Methylocella sp.]|nr:methylated-DNA--[protein]-cysteine S-methyltransferase [Methylocella sp.]
MSIRTRVISVVSTIGAITVFVQSLYVQRINTPTGRMIIIMDGEQRLRVLDWEDHEPRMQRLLRRHYGEIHLREEVRPTAVVHVLQAYFDGDLVALRGLPTATNGTDFQRAVWDALRHIAPGETISYGMLAELIGQPTAVRAVGLANGANPIAIVVPCHRVIGANGTLTGYGGGLKRKRWLLAHERARSPRSVSAPECERKRIDKAQYLGSPLLPGGACPDSKVPLPNPERSVRLNSKLRPTRA